MKIALVTYEYPPDTTLGGIATYARQAARVLADRNHHVEVFAASGRRSGRFEADGIVVNLVPELDRKLFASAVCPIFTARHREVQFDVLESPEYNADGRDIAKVHAGLPHVVKLHTPSELLDQMNDCRVQWRGWFWHHYHQVRMALGSLRRFRFPPSYQMFAGRTTRQPVLYDIERENAQKCHLVVSPSIALAEWAIQEWRLDGAKVMTVPYPYAATDELLRIGIGGLGKVVGYFGRLEQRKGVADLIEAIPLILKAEPAARFRFVGKPLEHAGTLERFDVYLLRRLKKFRHAIEVIGSRPLDEMPSHYQAVSVCVFPSIWENFPNVCLEAMAAGRAIVGSSAGGMREMLEDGKTGVLVPPSNPADLANAVIRLIQEPALREALGARARQRVLETYNSEVIGEQLEMSYATAIALSRQSLVEVHASR